MAFKDGVNYTAGLPFVRTSPDHGTAYAIAGKNEADAQSMRNALFMAIDIWARRNHFEEINDNPLPMTQFRREKFRIDF
jgi:4-hydroxythreonine-4-phosphate dehydrogenase